MPEVTHQQYNTVAELAFHRAIQLELVAHEKTSDDLQRALAESGGVPFPFEEAHEICRAAIQRALEENRGLTLEAILSSEATCPESPLRQLIRRYVLTAIAVTFPKG